MCVCVCIGVSMYIFVGEGVGGAYEEPHLIQCKVAPIVLTPFGVGAHWSNLDLCYPATTAHRLHSTHMHLHAHTHAPTRTYLHCMYVYIYIYSYIYTQMLDKIIGIVHNLLQYFYNLLY